MTNKEKYKQAFSVLHTSDEFSLEVEKMIQIKRKQRMNVAIAAAAACVILVGGSASAYAADLGGIQEKLSTWIHGSEVEVDVTDLGEGGYSFKYEENGTETEYFAGGASVDTFGNDEKMSANEVVSAMNARPDVDADEEGRVWVYYYNQTVDVTDLFDEDGVCRVALTHDGAAIYLEITTDEDGSYPYSWETELSEKKQALYTVIE